MLESPDPTYLRRGGRARLGKSIEHNASIIGKNFVHWISKKCIFYIMQNGMYSVTKWENMVKKSELQPGRMAEDRYTLIEQSPHPNRTFRYSNRTVKTEFSRSIFGT